MMMGEANTAASTGTPVNGQNRLQRLTIDELSKRCFYIDRDNEKVVVRLAPLEYKLLRVFLANPGICLSRARLLDEVWGYSFDIGTNSVDVAVYGLRKKLSGFQLDACITTVRSFGYRYDGP